MYISIKLDIKQLSPGRYLVFYLNTYSIIRCCIRNINLPWYNPSNKLTFEQVRGLNFVILEKSSINNTQYLDHTKNVYIHFINSALG